MRPTVSAPERLGRRLVPDADLPAWLHTLVGRIDGAALDSPLAALMAHVTPDARPSAVLMLFAEGPHGPDLLLTGRSATLRSHAGQPAFPGGRGEPGEDDVATALREAQEETGLDPASVRPAALLPHVFLPPSRHLVRPVLAWWAEPGPVGPVDPAETAVVARVPIAELVDPANRGVVILGSGHHGPAFQVADLLVWGFTGALVDVLLTVGGWSVPWDTGRQFPLVMEG